MEIKVTFCPSSSMVLGTLIGKWWSFYILNEHSFPIAIFRKCCYFDEVFKYHNWSCEYGNSCYSSLSCEYFQHPQIL